jgi:competence protein CoiA
MKMKYALVEGQRLEAHSGLTGKCQCCSAPVIARCGNVRIRHWAHKGKLNCDPWWEETEWHRGWKGEFPKECQEIVHCDDKGEKHFADVKIDQGYVIEFQHSPIRHEERLSRENFYKKMIWIIDGTRRLRDKDTFMGVWEDSVPVDGRAELRRLRDPVAKCALLRDWGSSDVPVFFDFSKQTLLGLLPKTKEGRVHVCDIKRDTLIASLFPATQVNSFEALIRNWGNLIATEENYLLWVAKGRPPMRRHL